MRANVRNYRNREYVLCLNVDQVLKGNGAELDVFVGDVGSKANRGDDVEGHNNEVELNFLHASRGDAQHSASNDSANSERNSCSVPEWLVGKLFRLFFIVPVICPPKQHLSNQ